MSDQSGLNLFRQTASAAGNFPVSRRGYDRQAVDDYVLGQEKELGEARKAVADLRYRLSDVENRPEPEPAPVEPVDYTHLGGNATQILRLAQVQAGELTDRAAREAARIVEEGRRAGSTAQHAGEQEAEDIKVAAVADLRQMRASMDRQASEQLNQARSESDSTVLAAQRHAESMGREAQRKVSGMLEAARLEATSVRQAAEKEAAKIRSDSALEREQLLARLTSEHDDASQKANQLLAEATQHHQQSQATFAQDAENAARARSEAMADAERIRINAAREAETVITKARKQATQVLARAESDASWRAEEMRRETESLGLRKQALMAQLASLSEMAKHTASEFIDVEPLEDFKLPKKESPQLAMTESKGSVSPVSATSQPSAPSQPGATSQPSAPSQPSVASQSGAPSQRDASAGAPSASTAPAQGSATPAQGSASPAQSDAASIPRSEAAQPGRQGGNSNNEPTVQLAKASNARPTDGPATSAAPQQGQNGSGPKQANPDSSRGDAGRPSQGRSGN